jgi:hypothetical protein
VEPPQNTTATNDSVPRTTEPGAGVAANVPSEGQWWKCSSDEWAKSTALLLREREEGGRKVSSKEEERELGLCLRVEDLLHLTGLGLGLMWMVEPKTTTPDYFLESQQESVAVTWLLVHTLVDFLVSCILLIAYSLLLKKCNLSPRISLIGYGPCLMKQMSLVRIFPFPSLMWTVKKKKKKCNLLFIGT